MRISVIGLLALVALSSIAAAVNVPRDGWYLTSGLDGGNDASYVPKATPSALEAGTGTTTGMKAAQAVYVRGKANLGLMRCRICEPEESFIRFGGLERRIPLAASRHRGKRIIVFHEDIEACNVIHTVLADAGVKSGVYHSKMKLRERAETLAAYRQGTIEVLVTCRALDEGFNVPETEIGIIAASTATRRQRIQRLGRVLRPIANKEAAMVYSLVASGPEIQRLKDEEAELEGVANVEWGRA